MTPFKTSVVSSSSGEAASARTKAVSLSRNLPLPGVPGVAPVKIERHLLASAGVLFAPQLQNERRQDAVDHLEAVDQGVVAGAERNQESFFGNARPSVVDMEALTTTRAAADPAGAVVAGDDPGAQTAKVSLVSDLPGVAGGAEAFFELSFAAADATP